MTRPSFLFFNQAVGIGVLMLLAGCSLAAQSRMDETDYSSEATTIYSGKSVLSPDKARKVSILPLKEQLPSSPGDFPARLIVETGDEHLAASIGFSLNAEILWSPDSKSFAVTGSGRGGNGQYNVDVFLIRSHRLDRVPITNLVEKEFGHPVRCSWPESPNVGAITWLIPSSQILIAAEIAHHSVCDSFGTFKAYTIDVTNSQILKKWNQLEVKEVFHEKLGPELLQADDNCIRNPKACRLKSNWQPNDSQAKR
jgi:hypothetical protein